jgi:hypothetical protein
MKNSKKTAATPEANVIQNIRMYFLKLEISLSIKNDFGFSGQR